MNIFWVQGEMVWLTVCLMWFSFCMQGLTSMINWLNVDLLLYAAAELQELLEPFLLRRAKGQVEVDVPRKTELVIYHGMTALQKKYYKAFLLKDRGEISSAM